ncbi:hypothetical protein D3C75_1077390 [compost metagenome]
MPPLRIPLASSTLIFFTASTSNAWACGTAASAAWFMLVSSCSTWAPMPYFFMALAALPRLPGNSMRTSGSLLKPPGVPSCLTATWAPWVRASLRPPVASFCDKSLNVKARALAESSRPAHRPAKVRGWGMKVSCQVGVISEPGRHGYARVAHPGHQD